MDIIYSICSWGLGHATRSLPILRQLINENHHLTVISHDRSLQLLKNELKDAVEYEDIPDYPMLVSKNTQQFIAKSLVYWPLFIKRMESGLQHLGKLLKDIPCDRIISDGRYDMYSKHIPSFFISHQIRIMNPLRLHLFERGSEIFNEFFFKRFQDIIIPDYKENNLSGDLSHNLKKIDENQLHYVGLLSDFEKKSLNKDIDYFISLSGPEPQRTILEQKIRTQLNHLNGTVIMSLGKTEETISTPDDHIKIYSYLSKEKRENLLNRSKLVISRSGYSTIMDLAVIGTQAFMIPTPGQIEQEYLAQHLKQTNICHSTTQHNLNLSEDIPLALKTKGFPGKGDVKKSVENVLNIVLS